MNRMQLIIVTLAALNTILHAVDPTFHLKNKSADAIQINVMQGPLSTGLKRIAKGGEFPSKDQPFPFALSTNKLATLEIYYCPTADYCKTNKPYKMVAELKPGKHSTIHIKFNGKKLERQIGGRLSGKTTSGTLDKDNIPQGNIDLKSKSSTETIKTTKEAIQEEMEKSKPAKPAQATTPESTKPAPQATTPPKPQTLPSKPTTTKKSAADITEIAWQQFPDAYAYRQTKNANATQIARLVLGVNKKSSEAEIKKAYHKAALTYHPDKNQSLSKEVTDETFKIITNARDRLLTPELSQKEPSEPPVFSKKDELLAILANAPEFVTIFGHSLHEHISHDYNSEGLKHIAQRIKAYPAETFGSAQAQWKKETLAIIKEALEEVK